MPPQGPQPIPRMTWLGRGMTSVRGSRGYGRPTFNTRRGGGSSRSSLSFAPYEPPEGYEPDLSQIRGGSQSNWDVWSSIYGFSGGAGAMYGIDKANFISAFFAGLKRVGPSEAAILSTAEPVVTVALAFVVLGERLTPAQLLGGALVLGAVVLLQLRPRPAAVPRRVPAAQANPGH